MKMLAIGLLIGMVVGGCLIVGPFAPVLAMAGWGDDDTSVLPDIEEILNQAIAFPSLQVLNEIEDEDIARFYRELLDRLGFSDIVKDAGGAEDSAGAESE